MREFIEDKKNIILIIALVIIVSIIILVVLNNNKKGLPDSKVTGGMVKEQEEFLEKWNGKIKDIVNLGDYYIVKNTVTKYFDFYANLFNEESNKALNAGILLDMYGKEYVEKYGLTADNLLEKLEPIHENDTYVVKGYTVSDYNGKTVYIAKCIVNDYVSDKNFDKTLIIVCNEENRAFAIYPSDYFDNFDINALQVEQEFNLDFNMNFENNGNNMYGSTSKTYEDFCMDTFNLFRKLAQVDKPTLYTLLDDQFKAERFPSYESFENYLRENSMNIFLMTFLDYDYNVNGELTTYTAYDKKKVINLEFDNTSLFNVKFKIK